MKKGLLSILTLAVTIVGCQNYDDQFDALNTQITALKSQVDGLAAVQSAVTALQGQLSALSSAALTSSDLDAALSSGLADIISDVEALQSSLADVATSADLDAINTDLGEVDESLQELLDSSNVYGEDLIVKNDATLAYAKSLGAKLTIVNGDVALYVTDEMNGDDVQEVLDNLNTVTGSFSYFAANSSVAPRTFNTLAAAGDIEVAQPGPYSFTGLTTAETIFLGDNYSSKVTNVDLSALTSVTALKTVDLNDSSSSATAAGVVTENTVTQNHGIVFTKSDGINLSSLPRYSGSTLTLKADDEDSTINIDSLASVDADGEESSLNLVITGSSSVDFSSITEGNVTISSATNVTGGTDHDGNVTLSKVTNAVLPNLTGTLTVSDLNELETLHVIGALANRPAGDTADTSHPVIDMDGQTALTSVILEGLLGNVTLKDNGNLVSINYSAEADAVILDNLDDLETLAMTGKAHSIQVINNGDLTTVNIDTELKTAKGNTSAAKTTGSLTVTDNAKLTDLASAFDPLSSLTITGNGDLTTLDFAGTDAIGAATDKATVTIGGTTTALGNALVANTVQNDYEATAPTAPAVGNGSISDDAGLGTLKAWLGLAVTASSNTGIKVYLDEIETYITEAAPGGTDTEINDINRTDADTTNDDKLTVINYVPEVTQAGNDEIAEQIAFRVPSGTGALDIDHTSGGITTAIVNLTSTNANPDLKIDQIMDDDNVAAADAVGLTLNAVRGGQATLDINITNVGSSTAEFWNYNGTQAAGSADHASATYIATDDYVSLTIDGLTVTTTTGTAISGNNALVAALESAWNSASGYGTGSASITASLFDVTSAAGKLVMTGKDGAGTRTNGKTASLDIVTGSVTTTHSYLGYKLGDYRTSSDNTTESNNIIVTLLADTAGTEGEETADVATTTGQVSQLSTTYDGTSDTNLPSAGTGDQKPGDARNDVKPAYDGTAGTTTQAETNINYSAWIGA